MSAASAPGLGSRFRPVPPQKGSFPLDHDGDCATIVNEYLNCLKLVQGVNAPNCRKLAKQYLSCRMDHELMDRDDFRNLGFAEAGPTDGNSKVPAKPSESSPTN